MEAMCYARLLKDIAANLCVIILFPLLVNQVGNLVYGLEVSYCQSGLCKSIKNDLDESAKPQGQHSLGAKATSKMT